MKLIRILRYLLIPFSLIYGLILLLRNLLYDVKLLRSYKTKIPSLGVGNLSLGGTGKSILVDYLLDVFSKDHFLGVISRGYGRKTKGYILANSFSTALDIGDEPLQFYKKHQDIKVVVCEDRVYAMKKLAENFKDISMLIFDDIMQHRRIKVDHLILTTSFSEPFFNDCPVPSGNLREFSNGMKRAKTILVTKCPTNLSESEKLNFIKKCKITEKQSIYFTTIFYSKTIINYKEKLKLNSLVNQKVLLITSIANPEPLLEYLRALKIFIRHLKYRDHFNFDNKSITNIRKIASGSIVLTTEKDYMRLHSSLKSNKLFYLPISLNFFSLNDENKFKQSLKLFS
tara:strand:- start:4410 stop:5435 length:1026 start_codon:yes stop_codon:yes gene_type:complete